MRFIFLVLTLLIFISNTVTSQTVVATQGGVCKDTNASLEWTVGEPSTETFSSSQNIITQGFHQPGLVIVAIEEVIPEYSITVFPNPVNEQLTVTNNGEEKKIFFVIVDINGKKAASGMFSDNRTVIDMSSLPTGVYLLRFFTANNINLKTCKVQKNK
jgi:hypothetical protein